MDSTLLSPPPPPQLIQLLKTIQLTREALPLLLRTFSTPLPLSSSTTSTSTITTIKEEKQLKSQERTNIYTSRYKNLNNLILNLSSTLLNPEIVRLFNEVEESEKLFGDIGIIERKREDYLIKNGNSSSSSSREGWNKLNEVLGDVSNTSTTTSTTTTRINESRKEKFKELELELEKVNNSQELNNWLISWKESLDVNIKNKIDLLEIGGGGGGREIKLILKGIMRCSLMLYYKKNGIILVERVACFGLKESVCLFSLSLSTSFSLVLIRSCTNTVGNEKKKLE